ncbi:MAG: ROK family protein [Anaerolineaceae bacterium]|nr:ROK family protein [Anaerolineaceae bacterium]
MAQNTNQKDDLINSAARILGININGVRTLLVYADLNGLIYERLQINTPPHQPFLNAFEIILNSAEKLLALTQAQHLPGPSAISLAISGDLDTDRGVLVSAPDLPEWKSAPVKGRLAMHFNLPVYIEQEANAGGVAEFYFGAGQEFSNIVFISMEPTVRTGIISDGIVFRSPGGYAGNLGEINMAEFGPAGYGLSGSLNGFASASGIVELAHLRFPHTWPADLDVYKLIAYARDGDINARKIFAESGKWLGKGLCPLVRLLHPEIMIIGNPGCLLEDDMLKPARIALQEATNLPVQTMPPLVPAKLGPRLPEMSALAAAINAFRHQ